MRKWRCFGRLENLTFAFECWNASLGKNTRKNPSRNILPGSCSPCGARPKRRLVKNQIIDGKTYKEDEQIAVPENGERVIQHPLGFAFDGLVLFGDTNQIPFQEKEGSCGADKACENEQKDGKHELKIKIAADFGNPVARCHYFFSRLSVVLCIWMSRKIY